MQTLKNLMKKLTIDWTLIQQAIAEQQAALELDRIAWRESEVRFDRASAPLQRLEPEQEIVRFHYLQKEQEKRERIQQVLRENSEVLEGLLKEALQHKTALRLLEKHQHRQTKKNRQQLLRKARQAEEAWALLKGENHEN